jgi:hypothetical protein
MNSRVEGNNINSEQAALALLQQVRFSGASSVFCHAQHERPEGS